MLKKKLLMQKIILYKKPKMQNSLSKIRRIRLKDISREKLKILKISSNKRLNKQRKNLAKRLRILLQEKKISNNMPVKN